MKSLTLAAVALLSFLPFNSFAASVDGNIAVGEYQWSTDGVEGSAKWQTFGGLKEVEDANGGDPWDITFLGIDVQDGKFQFGAVGGHILSGRETGKDIFLSDFAIDVNGDSTDPTISSAGFDYAIRLLSVDDQTGLAQFALLQGTNWEGANLYSNFYAPNHITQTYRMDETATTVATFVGSWAFNGNDDNVLEGEFDLSLLGLFDQNLGGMIATYITMSCVNDEALVYADVAPVPVPAAALLFAPALLGLMGIRRRKQAD